MPQTPERKRQYYLERKARKDAEMKAVAAAWRDNNREKLRAANKQRRLEQRAKCLVAAARIRARKRNIPCDITAAETARLQAVIDVGVCELSGVELTLSGPRSATSPSLDRIKPHLGYVAGNMRIVCHALNAGMGDWGENELKRIAQRWLA